MVGTCSLHKKMYWFCLLFNINFTNTVSSTTPSVVLTLSIQITPPPWTNKTQLLPSIASLLFVQLQISGWFFGESSKTFVCVVGFWPLSGFTGSAQHKASNRNDRISPSNSIQTNPGTPPLLLFCVDIINSKHPPLHEPNQASLPYYLSNYKFLVDFLENRVRPSSVL